MGSALKPFRTAADAVAFCCLSVVVACAFSEAAVEAMMLASTVSVSEFTLPLDADPDV